MSLNGILSSAMSALQTNSAALRVVSNNIANLNTQGYTRRVVNEQTQVAGGQLVGVEIGDIQRMADQFLQAETLSANASSSQYSAQTDAFTQLNGVLGQPGDGTSLGSQLDNVYAALGNAALAPNTSANQQSVLNALQNLATRISQTSSSISNLQSQVDGQVSTAVSSANALIKNIYDLNQQIEVSTFSGDGDSGLLDQRDQAVQSLSQLIGVRTAEQANGQLQVMTADGTSLVGDFYTQLSYTGGSTNGAYGPITAVSINGQSGAQVGASQVIDSHLGAGQIAGLVDMRDNQLGGLMNELGNFAKQTALAFNSQSNANSAVPPPASMTGRNTGLLSSDALNFTGKTTIAVADASGNLVSRIDVDFGAGTLSVDGGGAVGIGSTVGSFAAALNSALGGNGSANFANGVLSISANGSNGIVVQDDASTPSSRGGTGFSQFFGLNDIFQSAAPSILSTGLSVGDAGGFAAGGTMSFALKNASGGIDKQASVTLPAGLTIGQIVTALNTAFGGAATFALNANGAIGVTPSAANSGDTLNVTSDTTQRGTTGVSFTQLFGIGQAQTAAQAQDFSVTGALATTPSRLPFAQSSMTVSTIAGQSILGPGDARGLIALQNLATAKQNFAAVGALGAQTASLSDYAASFYQDVSTRTNVAQSQSTTQSDRLTEAQSRLSSESGVNLDEELSNMMVYQQAYAAGARVLQTGQQLYDTLLQAMQ